VRSSKSGGEGDHDPAASIPHFQRRAYWRSFVPRLCDFHAAENGDLRHIYDKGEDDRPGDHALLATTSGNGDMSQPRVVSMKASIKSRTVDRTSQWPGRCDALASTYIPSTNATGCMSLQNTHKAIRLGFRPVNGPKSRVGGIPSVKAPAR
jgi:hypothetical protein